MQLISSAQKQKMRDSLKESCWKFLDDRLPAFRRSTQEMKGWLIEYAFSSLLRSTWADYAIQQTQHLFVGSLLLQLRDLEDFFGLLQAFSPSLMYVCVQTAVIVLKYLRKARVTQSARALTD